jgi:hypothetical protein
MASPLQLGFDGHHRIRNHTVTRTIDPMESIERVYWAGDGVSLQSRGGS